MGIDLELVAARYLVDDVDQGVLEREYGGVLFGVSEAVWRFVKGEGYSLDEWADVLEKAGIYNPFKAIERFAQLVEKGLRWRYRGVEPANIDFVIVFRYASKIMGWG